MLKILRDVSHSELFMSLDRLHEGRDPVPAVSSRWQWKSLGSNTERRFRTVVLCGATLSWIIDPRSPGPDLSPPDEFTLIERGFAHGWRLLPVFKLKLKDLSPPPPRVIGRRTLMPR